MRRKLTPRRGLMLALGVIVVAAPVIAALTMRPDGSSARAADTGGIGMSMASMHGGHYWTAVAGAFRSTGVTRCVLHRR